MFKYTTIKSFLSKEECNKIVDFSLNKLNLQKAGVAGHYENVRKSDIAFANYKIYFPDIIEKFENLLKDMVKVKGYDLDFSGAHYQFTQYKEGDYYDWHRDSNEFNENSFRYCSVVIQLTGDYIGGDFYLNDVVYNKPIGEIYNYDSDVYHEVKPIINGINLFLIVTF